MSNTYTPEQAKADRAAMDITIPTGDAREELEKSLGPLTPIAVVEDFITFLESESYRLPHQKINIFRSK